MEILKFENSQRPVRKKSSSSKVVLGLASIAAVAMLGSTLAASISLNTGTGVEFGQGVSQTVACDSEIITTPEAKFTNASDAGAFTLSTVAFSGIADACAGKTFTLRGYGDSSATPLTLATVGSTEYTSATFVFATSGTANVSAGIDAAAPANGSANAHTFTIGFQGTQATNGAVAKLTLESQ